MSNEKMMIPSIPTGRRATRVSNMAIVSPDFKREPSIEYLESIRGAACRIREDRVVVALRENVWAALSLIIGGSAAVDWSFRLDYDD